MQILYVNMLPMHTSTYLTPAEVAADLSVSRMTVNRWCHDGTLPASRFGNLWRIDREAYAAYKAAAKVTSS